MGLYLLRKTDETIPGALISCMGVLTIRPSTVTWKR